MGTRSDTLTTVTTTRDKWVPWLVAVGGFAVGVGWLVGVVWLWSSQTWTRGEKALATLVVPGGIALSLPLLVFSLATRTSDCTKSGGPGHQTVTLCARGWHATSPNTMVLAALVAAPVIIAVNLDKARRSRTPR